MNGFIFGFQRLVWCPKCTPASNNSGTNSVVSAIEKSHRRNAAAGRGRCYTATAKANRMLEADVQPSFARDGLRCGDRSTSKALATRLFNIQRQTKRSIITTLRPISSEDEEFQRDAFSPLSR